LTGPVKLSNFQASPFRFDATFKGPVGPLNVNVTVRPSTGGVGIPSWAITQDFGGGNIGVGGGSGAPGFGGAGAPLQFPENPFHPFSGGPGSHAVNATAVVRGRRYW
jgi:hypothetical protein